MPIFKLIEEDHPSPEVKQTYEKIKSRYGGALPDVYKAFANDPEYVDSLNDHMSRVLAPRKVGAYDDEAIAEILGTAALWSELTRFNISARMTLPRDGAKP